MTAAVCQAELSEAGASSGKIVVMHLHHHRTVKATTGALYKECHCGRRKVVRLAMSGYTGIDAAWETDLSRQLPGFPAAPAALLAPQIREIRPPAQKPISIPSALQPEAEKVEW